MIGRQQPRFHNRCLLKISAKNLNATGRRKKKGTAMGAIKKTIPPGTANYF